MPRPHRFASHIGPRKEIGRYGSFILVRAPSNYGSGHGYWLLRGDGQAIMGFIDYADGMTYSSSQTDYFREGDEGHRVYELLKKHYPHAVDLGDDKKVRLAIKGRHIDEMARMLAFMYDTYRIVV